MWPFRNRSPRADDLAKELRSRVEELTTGRKPSAGLSKVTLCYEDSSSEYLVAESDLLRFLAAALELHYEPGRNPHSNFDTAQALAITVVQLRPQGPYWWTTPGLQENYDNKGAVVFCWDPVPVVVWQRPGAELPEYVQAHV